MRYRAGLTVAISVAWLAAFLPPQTGQAQTVVNDITQLNPIEVAQVVVPNSVDEISRIVASHDGPVSIGGGRFSQGGQIATTGTVFIDMRQMNRILDLNVEHRLITVEAGITWRDIQEVVGPKGLSPLIMQSYSNFTVGGSLSVNCHGRYVDQGPLVKSVVSIRLVMADGSVKTASRMENPDLFAAAIGGYGGIGVIVEATLKLSENQKLERVAKPLPLNKYRAFYDQHVRGSDTAIMHSATLYPPDFDHLNVVTSSLSDKALSISEPLAPQTPPSAWHRFLLGWLTSGPGGKWVREYVYDPLVTNQPIVVMRNYEQAQDVITIEPVSRAQTTTVLQEYFIPVDRLEAFVPRMAAVFKARHVNVLNVSIRHAEPDTDTLLAWAPREVFALVIYFEQGTDATSRSDVADWTRQLIDLAEDQGGTYYLPYQIVATKTQFLKAYPRASEYFAVKSRVDPTYKFRNRLWDAYYAPNP